MRQALLKFLAVAPVVVPLGMCGQVASPPSVQIKAESLVSAARQLATKGDLSQAEDKLRQALELDSTSILANDTYGNLLLQSKRLPEAMERFEVALATKPQDPPARAGERKAAVALALRARTAGDNDAALVLLQHVHAVLPDDVEILLDLGVQALNMHRLGIASEALHAGLALGPDHTKLLYALARVEVEQELFGDAKTHYLAYLRLNPGDASAHYGLGRLYQMQQQTELAIAEFNRSIDLLPAQAESYYQLGQMQLDAHHDVEANASFNKALASMPNHGGALTGMGILAYRLMHYDTADIFLSRAVVAAPDYQLAHYYRGLALRRLGKQEEAQGELEKATALAASQQGRGQPVQSP